MVDGFTFLARTLFLLSRLGPLERNGKDTVRSAQFNSISLTQNQCSVHMGPEGYFIATKKSKETALQDLSWVFW